jgi:hypothetical protein
MRVVIVHNLATSISTPRIGALDWSETIKFNVHVDLLDSSVVVSCVAPTATDVNQTHTRRRLMCFRESLIAYLIGLPILVVAYQDRLTYAECILQGCNKVHTLSNQF